MFNPESILLRSMIKLLSSSSLSREISRRGPHAPGYEVKAPSNVAPITRPLVG